MHTRTHTQHHHHRQQQKWHRLNQVYLFLIHSTRNTNIIPDHAVMCVDLKDMKRFFFTQTFVFPNFKVFFFMFDIVKQEKQTNHMIEVRMWITSIISNQVEQCLSSKFNSNAQFGWVNEWVCMSESNWRYYHHKWKFHGEFGRIH